MAWKTRKNTQRKTQRGGSLAKYFTKKAPAPLASQLATNTKNTSVMYGRKGSLTDFTDLKKRKAFAAKSIRNQVKVLKNSSNEVRNSALELMNESVRNRTRKVLNYPALNSLSNDALIELYATGKVRSASA